MIYPKIYADYQQRSFQTQTAKLSGTRLWFVPTSEMTHNQHPKLILLHQAGLTVQFQSRLIGIGYDGNRAWETACDGDLPAVAGNGNVYYRGIDGDLHGIDPEGRELFDEFPIPNCFDLGGVLAVKPIQEDLFLFQTFNRPEEVEAGYPPEKDDYNLILTGPEMGVQWKWLQQFEGKVLPGIASDDENSFIMLNDRSQITAFNIEDGKQTKQFSVEGATFADASIDHENNLIVALKTIDGERKLVSYTLSGELNWEYLLPSAAGWSHQPPAIDSNDRMYYIVNSTLLAIDKGRLIWEKEVPSGRLQYLTILGDNSILVVAGIEIDHFDGDGNVLLEMELEEEEVITTPPVVDDKCRLYIGTVSGVHCLE
jgi:outer membrane protein assembly factor BamB